MTRKLVKIVALNRMFISLFLEVRQLGILRNQTSSNWETFYLDEVKRIYVLHTVLPVNLQLNPEKLKTVDNSI